MTPESTDSMRSACHVLAEHVLRMPAYSNRCKWLKEQIATLLKTNDHILWYAQAYENDYPYADAPTEYLASILKAYDDEEVN
tara:strand:- start:374 stop:619 length:246 start_codon:yes stop_codon:yes gene_type:complete